MAAPSTELVKKYLVPGKSVLIQNQWWTVSRRDIAAGTLTLKQSDWAKKDGAKPQPDKNTSFDAVLRSIQSGQYGIVLDGTHYGPEQDKEKRAALRAKSGKMKAPGTSESLDETMTDALKLSQSILNVLRQNPDQQFTLRQLSMAVSAPEEMTRRATAGLVLDKRVNFSRTSGYSLGGQYGSGLSIGAQDRAAAATMTITNRRTLSRDRRFGESTERLAFNSDAIFNVLALLAEQEHPLLVPQIQDAAAVDTAAEVRASLAILSRLGAVEIIDGRGYAMAEGVDVDEAVVCLGEAASRYTLVKTIGQWTIKKDSNGAVYAFDKAGRGYFHYKGSWKDEFTLRDVPAGTVPADVARAVMAESVDESMKPCPYCGMGGPRDPKLKGYHPTCYEKAKKAGTVEGLDEAAKPCPYCGMGGPRDPKLKGYHPTCYEKAKEAGTLESVDESVVVLGAIGAAALGSLLGKLTVDAKRAVEKVIKAHRDGKDGLASKEWAKLSTEDRRMIDAYLSRSNRAASGQPERRKGGARFATESEDLDEMRRPGFAAADDGTFFFKTKADAVDWLHSLGIEDETRYVIGKIPGHPGVGHFNSIAIKFAGRPVGQAFATKHRDKLRAAEKKKSAGLGESVSKKSLLVRGAWEALSDGTRVSIRNSETGATYAFRDRKWFDEKTGKQFSYNDFHRAVVGAAENAQKELDASNAKASVAAGKSAKAASTAALQKEVMREASRVAGWFDVLASGSDTVEVSTRENGDVGAERAGAADIKQGRMIAKVLAEKYGKNRVSFDVDDEWVTVSVRVTEALGESAAADLMRASEYAAEQGDFDAAQTLADVAHTIADDATEGEALAALLSTCVEMHEEYVFPVLMESDDLDEGYQHVHFNGSKSVRYNIAMPGGKTKSVQGRTFGKYLGVHMDNSGEGTWVLTHIPTGMAIANRSSLKQEANFVKAMKAAEEKLGDDLNFATPGDANEAARAGIKKLMKQLSESESVDESVDSDLAAFSKSFHAASIDGEMGAAKATALEEYRRIQALAKRLRDGDLSKARSLAMGLDVDTRKALPASVKKALGESSLEEGRVRVTNSSMVAELKHANIAAAKSQSGAMALFTKLIRAVSAENADDALWMMQQAVDAYDALVPDSVKAYVTGKGVNRYDFSGLVLESEDDALDEGPLAMFKGAVSRALTPDKKTLQQELRSIEDKLRSTGIGSATRKELKVRKTKVMTTLLGMVESIDEALSPKSLKVGSYYGVRTSQTSDDWDLILYVTAKQSNGAAKGVQYDMDRGQAKKASFNGYNLSMAQELKSTKVPAKALAKIMMVVEDVEDDEDDMEEATRSGNVGGFRSAKSKKLKKPKPPAAAGDAEEGGGDVSESLFVADANFQRFLSIANTLSISNDVPIEVVDGGIHVTLSGAQAATIQEALDSAPAA